MINTNIKKNQQTTGLILKLNNNIYFLQLLLFQINFVSESFSVVYKFVLHGKHFLAKQIWGTEQNMAKFSRVPIWRINYYNNNNCYNDNKLKLAILSFFRCFRDISAESTSSGKRRCCNMQKTVVQHLLSTAWPVSFFC